VRYSPQKVKRKKMNEKEECERRLMGTLAYVKALTGLLRPEELEGMERDMIVLLAQIKNRGEKKG